MPVHLISRVLQVFRLERPFTDAMLLAHMDQGYYKTGPQRAPEVQRLFADIAHRYDLVNDVQSLGLHRIWKRRAVDVACSNGGILAADVCSGTGDLARELAKRGKTVLALDFSLPMLLNSPGFKGKTRIFPHQNIQADALSLPIKNETMEIVTMAYGLRNLSSVEKGIEEMCRITTENGTVTILDFGKPSTILWRWFYFFYLGLGLPVIGKLIVGNSAAYGYILKSLRAFPGPEEISALMTGQGCRSVQHRCIMGGAMTLHKAIKG